MGTESKVVLRVGVTDRTCATWTPIRSGVAVATCGTVPPCALQSCCDTPSRWTPVEDDAGSSHCFVARPWCAEDVSADELHASAQSTLDTGTAARMTSTTTLIQCFQPTVSSIPRCVGSAATPGVGAAHYS